MYMYTGYCMVGYVHTCCLGFFSFFLPCLLLFFSLLSFASKVDPGARLRRASKSPINSSSCSSAVLVMVADFDGMVMARCVGCNVVSYIEYYASAVQCVNIQIV